MLRQRRSGPILPVHHVPRDARLNRLNARRPGGRAFRDFRENPFCLTIVVVCVVLFVAFLAFLAPTMTRSISADEIPWSQSRKRGYDGLRRKRRYTPAENDNLEHGARGMKRDSRGGGDGDGNENDLMQQGGRALHQAKRTVAERTKRKRFSCSDGTFGFLNDDYCDCSDGSDEPETSACSNLLVSQRIFPCADGNGDTFTSRVRDGIKDCADGSDEVSM